VIGSVHFHTIQLLAGVIAFAHKELCVPPIDVSHLLIPFSRVSLCDLIGLVFAEDLSGGPTQVVQMLLVIIAQNTHVLSIQLQASQEDLTFFTGSVIIPLLFEFSFNCPKSLLINLAHSFPVF
jgi:hypothetical protein